jgi:hypothetical protein
MLHDSFSARNRTALAVVLLAVAMPTPVAAQGELGLKKAFEGRRVTVKIDMPGTSDGVDIHTFRTPSIDFRKHGDRLKDYGASIRAGQSATVTLVKMKGDLIEFQLDGGGFGTLGDDASTSVDIPRLEKSSREKDLEDRIKTETNARDKRDMERELDDLRRSRERENRRIEAARIEAEELQKARIADQRLRSGSRFNVRYEGRVPNGYAPEDLVAALREYVDFTGEPGTMSGAPSAGDDVPWKGMLRDEAESQFGTPIDVSERREGSLTVVTLIFVRPGQRITAEFVEDVLIRYSIASR